MPEGPAGATLAGRPAWVAVPARDIREGPPCAVELLAPHPCWPPPSWAPRRRRRRSRPSRRSRTSRRPRRDGAGERRARHSCGRAHLARRLPPPRGHLRGEPLLRQPLRRLGPGRPGPGGRPRAGPPDRAHPGGQNGSAYGCLLQDDVNLTSPPLADRCADTGARGDGQPLHQRPVPHRRYIGPRTRPARAPGVFAPNGVLKDSPGALPGGCTRDLVHRFYQEQYQLERRQAEPLRHRLATPSG